MYNTELSTCTDSVHFCLANVKLASRFSGSIVYALSSVCVCVSDIWVVCVTDEWVKFDDDKVSVVTPEDILKLSGGGDWHIAYVLLYGPRRLEILEEDQ